MKTFKKSIAIAVVCALMLVPISGFAATFGGVVLEDSALSISETFDTWTTIKDTYNGKCGIFTHRYAGNTETAKRREPAINEIAVATEEMAPYKAAGDTYLDFRMMGGELYTNRYNTALVSEGNLVATPRIFIQSSAAIGSIVDEKLHVSFELKTDDLQKEKHVKYCQKWGDTTNATRNTWLLRMHTNGIMTIGHTGDTVTMPYKLGRWYKFDYVYDFGNSTFAAYVDGNKVYETTNGFTFTFENTAFFQFVIDGDAIDIPEGLSAGMGIDNLNISLHKASDEIVINKKQGLPASEVGMVETPEYEFGTAGTYTVNIPYTLFDLGQSGQVVVASYNPDGTLDKVAVGDSIASGNLAVGKVCSAKIDVSQTANKIRVFLLDDMENVNPIIPKIEISALN